jgi:hypothetical protein
MNTNDSLNFKKSFYFNVQLIVTGSNKRFKCHRENGLQTKKVKIFLIIIYVWLIKKEECNENLTIFTNSSINFHIGQYLMAEHN